MAKSRKQKPNRGAQIFVSLSLLFMIGLGLFVYFANLRQTAEKAAAPRPLTGFVQDSANLIDRDIRMGIEAKLRAFDALGGPQLVIATRYALDRPIEDEAIRLARAWKIGRAGADNGDIVFGFCFGRFDGGHKWNGRFSRLLSMSEGILDPAARGSGRWPGRGDGSLLRAWA